MTQTRQGGPEKKPGQMAAQMPTEITTTREAPLGSARNPIQPGESRPGWTTGPGSPFVVHGEVDK